VKTAGPNPSAHSGFTEWLLQRATALYLAGFLLYVLVRLAIDPPADYSAWRAWFAYGPVRIAWALAFASLLIHAWTGSQELAPMLELLFHMQSRGWVQGLSESRPYGDGPAEAAGLGDKGKAIFDSLFEPHQQFHEASKLALTQQQAGDAAAAREAMTAMHKLSALLVNRLLELDGLAQ